MAEEHEFQAQDQGHRLCANNCGFFGSPATLNLCSKCFRDLRLKEEQGALAKAALDNTKIPVYPSPGSSTQLKIPVSVEVGLISTVEGSIIEAQVATPSTRPNRCLTCNKRVGLTGFKCRCGLMFCGSHRYPEHHGCTFDYKSAGKEAIAKANPVIKAEKLEKI
ncbi:zinc finger A20 and AN1 domain-containing stress-associated protein 4-like [Amaranthus tricolor]|uniref:zinc finger A20 and AN1 domain-containing stress-associated protein 4-like n=1 Tax=Amaranthus tricolor TaxID=29722 RepID=UPI00258DB21B|nr:zinc finger A20 and AN1 domain-containing stress-associated protein 4-like [Amaranthus tricolor]